MKNPVTKPSPAYAGVDIGKSSLDLSLGEHALCRHQNDKAGIAALIKSLKKLPQPVQVICEPSGGYERDLLEALWAADLAVSLVHAARVRAFARAQGLLAKTDPIDAVVLCERAIIFDPGVIKFVPDKFSPIPIVFFQRI